MVKRWAMSVLLASLVCAGVSRTLAARDGRCRPPTPPEKAAFLKLDRVLHDVVEAPLLAADWLAKGDAPSIDDLTVAIDAAPPRPLMACSGGFDVTLQVNPESPRGRKLQAEAEADQKLGTNEGYVKMFKVVALETLGIRVEENDPYLRAPITGEITKLDLQGPDLAYRSVSRHDDGMGGEDDTSYACFGDWKTLPVQTEDYVPFPFVHKPQTPFIENFCVIVSAPVEVADPVLKSIDWTRLKGALTR